MRIAGMVAGLALLSSACAHGIGGASDTGHLLEPGGAVHVNVSNQSGGPMEVYAVGSGSWYRIGTVHPGLDGRFTVRPTMVVNGALELVARSTSGLQVSSGPVLLGPGDEVDFALGTQASLSSATVRPRSALRLP
jgi:hypothetical protein